MDLLTQQWVLNTLLIAMVGVAAVVDYKTHRIPNWLSFSGWYLGPLIHFYFSGMPAFYSSLYGLLIVLAITFPLFVMRWMGAGDVKLMVSVGALVGSTSALNFIAVIFITGAIAGILQLLLRGVFGTWIKRYWLMLGMSLTSGRTVYVDPGKDEIAIKMPYGVSIAVGTFVALCLF